MEGGPEDGKLVALGTTTTMGRESDNDLVVPEAQVSRNHAEIVLTEQGYCIRDLSNTNGTFRRPLLKRRHPQRTSRLC